MKRFNKQMIFPLIAVALLAVGCKKEKLPNGASQDISVVATVEGEATKLGIVTQATGQNGVTFMVKDGASAPMSWTGSTMYKGDVAATTGEVTFAPPVPQYHPNGHNAYFFAFYPSGGLTNDVAVWDMMPIRDVLITDEVWDAGNYNTPISTGMKLNHQTSRVEVICKADGNALYDVVKASWGDITGIAFVDAPSKMKLDLSATPKVTTSSPKTLSLVRTYTGMPFEEKAIPASTNITPDAMAMIAPITPTANESFKLKVTTTGTGSGEMVMEVPVSLNGTKDAMKKGKIHTVTLTFKADGKNIEVTSTTIEDWRDGFSGDNSFMPATPGVIEYGVSPYNVTSGDFEGYRYTLSAPTLKSYNDAATGAMKGSEILAMTDEPSFKRFEVSASDDAIDKSWADAVTACKNKITNNGGGWRMPRLSEMMQIALNIDALKASGINGMGASVIYWSASEYSTTASWIVTYKTADQLASHPKSNTTGYNVRCVREIPEYPFIDGKVITTQNAYGSSGLLVHPKWTQTPDHTYNDEISNQVAAKFEVFLGDNNASTWTKTNINCTTPWRLPTKAELIIMGRYRTQLSMTASAYWSSTGAASANDAVVLNSLNQIVAAVKTGSYGVRCVKDL